jgi:glycosyltransferase involved in cell wall biosynthesis
MSAPETPQHGIFLHDIEVNPQFWNTPLPFNKIFKKGYYCFLINQQVDQWIKDLSIDVLLFYNLALYPLSQKKSCFKIYDLGDDHAELFKAELGLLHYLGATRLVEALMVKMMQNCDLVTTISKDLEQRYPVPSTLLSNGVNLTDTHPGEGQALRDALKRPIVGFVGSLEYFIDFDMIMETASRMPDITFLIAGGGRQMDRIVKIKQEKGLVNLHLTGGLKHSEILRHIDAMDICLNLFIKSPLTHAACPIKLFEYLAYQKPVVSTRIREVQNMDKGFLYYADDAAELEQVITRILADPQEAEKKSALGFSMVQQKYTWDKIAEEFLEAIEKAKQR